MPPIHSARPWIYCKKPGFFFWIPVSLLLWLSVCTPTLLPAQDTATVVHDWQVRGAMAAFNDSIPVVKALAIKKLIELNRTDSLQAYMPLLLTYLQSEDRNIRRAAIDALGKQPALALEVIQKLVELLSSEDTFVQMTAIDALGKQPSLAPTVIQKLVELLNSVDNFAQTAAADALGNQAPLEAVVIQQLVELLNNEDRFVKRSATIALGKQPSLAPTVIQKLAKLLNNEDVFVQMAAANALGNQAPMEAAVIQQLVKLLNNEDRYVREAAAIALGKQLSLYPAVIQQLVELLNNEDSYVREAAADALGNQPSLSAAVIQQLTNLLNSEDYNLQRASAIALGNQASLSPAVVQQLANLLNSQDSYVRGAAADALGNQPSLSAAVIQQLTNLLNSEDYNLQRASAIALGNQASLSPAVVQQLANLLNSQDSYVREAAADALGNQPTPLPFQFIPFGLHGTYLDAAITAERRYQAYYLGGGNPKVEILLKWIGKPGNNHPKADTLTLEEQRVVLSVFAEAWPATESSSEMRADLVLQLSAVTQEIDKHEGQPLVGILQTHQENLQKAGFASQAAAVKAKIDDIRAENVFYQVVKNIAWVLLGHLLFWVVLIWAYPTNTRVQSIFFWNPWIRQFGGLGYVHLALTTVPFLQRRLLIPFKQSLIEDARLDSFREDSYFTESEVIQKETQLTTPLIGTLATAQGLAVLEGASGLGKTMYLRYLAKQNPNNVAAYLTASQCVGGVVEALSKKVQGMARDINFLNSLIHNRAIAIYLDGVNEVGPDTRMKISEFISQFRNAQGIITTQHIKGVVPEKVPVYKLLPLKPEKVKAFLAKRSEVFSFSEAACSKEDYQTLCNQFIDAALNNSHLLEEERKLNEKVLSNPLDLTVVGQMLYNGKEPNLSNLQSEYYQQMANGYEEDNNVPFPLGVFSEHAYQMRLQNKDFTPVETFHREVRCMADEKYKMVLISVSDIEGRRRDEWRFRHDKIREFFLAQTFLTNPVRQTEHVKDTPFRGVYFMLATLLSLPEAKRLGKELHHYAIDNNDHLLSDEYMRLLWIREELAKKSSDPGEGHNTSLTDNLQPPTTPPLRDEAINQRATLGS